MTGLVARDEDLDYLDELLGDFGVRPTPLPDLALGVVTERFEGLVQEAVEGLLCVDENSPAGWVTFMRDCHRRIFDGLLANAGQFRRADEAAHNVHFGGYDPRTMRERHTGSPPGEIEADLLRAFSYLQPPGDPVVAAARAYERMQNTHPFYDANGRIGRLVVTLFLAEHRLRFNWSLLDTPPTPPRRRPRKEDLYEALSHAQRRRGRDIGKLVKLFRAYIQPFPEEI